MDKARKAAIAALNSVFINDSYSNITLDNTFKSADLSPLDRSFASALFYGVLDRKITLDYILSDYLKKGIEKTPVYVVNALRMALYQILFMDKVPESAAVNESVNLVKASKFKYAASLVNGVLRSILRNGIKIPDDESIASLSVKYSCPEYMIEDFVNDYGIETAVELLKQSLFAPSVYLKVNTVKTDSEALINLLKKEKITAEACDTENALKVVGGIDVSSSECYKNGFFHIEDLACQKAVKVLDVKPGEKVLDMCSAPGGKAFSMAEDMKNSGEIVACDIYKSRTELIAKGAKRLGLGIIKPTLCDAGKFEFSGTFDAILCDVPCSGYGVLRRKPEIKYKPANDFEELSEIQFNIISNADKLLKSGGRIMYSTCTLRKAENEGIISRFLDKYPDYKLKYEHTFMPHIDGTDGFYCALLEKSR